jgi:hypothetical protein
VSEQTVLDRLQRAFRVGAFPLRIKAIERDAARYYGIAGVPPLDRVIAYVRHNYTNYERVCRYTPCSQVDHYEFRKWVNIQIAEALNAKAKALEVTG